MSEDLKLSKISILIQQKKWADAERLLTEMLSTDANNLHYLYLLAEVFIGQKKFENAAAVINHAIGLSPDSPHGYYIKSKIAIEQENFYEAENILRQAIGLDPNDADYYALLAQIKIVRKKFAEALEIANRALEIDAENLSAINARSTALNKLNRKEEAFETIEGGLREDPNNAYTHANYGWGLLEKGNHKKALEHFKEALKNDPNLEFAQAGMLEAIKASNPVYRLFLKYAFWMNNLNAKYQWFVIIGFYLGVRGLRILAASNETLRPYLTPLIIALTLIAFSTWVINPIGNLFLRFNKYGKLLLDKKEKLSSSLVAISLCLSVIGILLYFILGDDRTLTIAVFGFAMMLPLGTMLSPSKNKYGLLLYTIVLAILGISAIGITFQTGELFNGIGTLFLLGFVGFQWLANYLLIKESNY